MMKTQDLQEPKVLSALILWLGDKSIQLVLQDGDEDPALDSIH